MVWCFVSDKKPRLFGLGDFPFHHFLTENHTPFTPAGKEFAGLSFAVLAPDESEGHK